MENLKKGDIVELTEDFSLTLFAGKQFNVNDDQLFSHLLCANPISSDILIPVSKLKKIGGSQMQYEESNRYKLAQAIKKTGISAKALSRAVAGNECYFYNKTGVARFNKRGDIPDDVLNLALTDLRYAEREVLGIGADTVEDTPVVETQHMESANGEVHYFIINESIEEKPKSNKPLFIGAAVVISIVFILFILSNYLQVV